MSALTAWRMLAGTTATMPGRATLGDPVDRDLELALQHLVDFFGGMEMLVDHRVALEVVVAKVIVAV